MADARPQADTRERILDAAEHLFMTHGYDGTSMRQITGEAAVNLAAVNYHFGSKESLMQEVFRRRLDGLNEERMVITSSISRIVFPLRSRVHSNAPRRLAWRALRGSPACTWVVRVRRMNCSLRRIFLAVATGRAISSA
mgnify:CR=1 FL=1